MAPPLSEEVRDSEQHDTWSRAELLRARGYPEDVIAGNGHPRPPTAFQHETSKTVVDAESGNAARLCAGGCGTVLEGPESKRWCSEGCRQRHRRQHVPPVLPQEVTEAVAVDDSPSPPPAVSYDVLALVAAIPAAMPAGWQLRASADGVELHWPVWADA